MSEATKTSAVTGTNTEKAAKHTTRYTARYLTVTAMLSAVAFILKFFDFSVPVMPSFIKMDLSDLPELIGAFSMGPLCGVLVALIKNLLHLTISSTGGVGELSNFLLGAAFVLPAGLIYRAKKTKARALWGAVLGAVVMGVFSVISNNFLVYPFYYNFMAKDAILAAYQAILPGMKSILQCLICFNMPFTIVKGLLSVAITMLVYKPLSPILKGRR